MPVVPKDNWPCESYTLSSKPDMRPAVTLCICVGKYFPATTHVRCRTPGPCKPKYVRKNTFLDFPQEKYPFPLLSPLQNKPNHLFFTLVC